jgi:hypothetical protein
LRECSSLGPQFYDQFWFDESSLTPPLRWMATLHPEQEARLRIVGVARIQLMILSKAGARDEHDLPLGKPATGLESGGGSV